MRTLYTATALLALLSGCGSGNARYTDDSAADDDEDYESFAPGPSAAEQSEVEDALRSARSAAEEVEWQVSRFSDGSTNWQYVVPDAEYAISDLESAVSRLDAAVASAGMDNDVDVASLRSRAADLRSQVDAFSYSSWEDVVPELEAEAYDAGSAVGDVEFDVDQYDYSYDDESY